MEANRSQQQSKVIIVLVAIIGGLCTIIAAIAQAYVGRSDLFWPPTHTTGLTREQSLIFEQTETSLRATQTVMGQPASVTIPPTNPTSIPLPSPQVVVQVIPSPQPTATTCYPKLPSGSPITAETLSQEVGGNASFWTQNSELVWTYSNKDVNARFRHPGGNFVMTYWAGFPAPSNTTGCNLEKMTYNGGPTYWLECNTSGATFSADGVGLHISPMCFP